MRKRSVCDVICGYNACVDITVQSFWVQVKEVHLTAPRIKHPSDTAVRNIEQPRDLQNKITSLDSLYYEKLFYKIKSDSTLFQYQTANYSAGWKGVCNSYRKFTLVQCPKLTPFL
jgi:hypothetical protein